LYLRCGFCGDILQCCPCFYGIDWKINHVIITFVVVLLYGLIFLLGGKMKRFGLVMYLAVVGALCGLIVGEFFPGKVQHDDILGVIGSAVSRPFSHFRNDLALKYALIGIIAGAVAGFIYIAISKEK